MTILKYYRKLRLKDKILRKFDGRFTRLRMVMSGVIVGFVLLQIGLFQRFNIEIAKSDNQNATVNYHLRKLSTRLDIVDRNGVLLARNIIAHDLYIRPYRMYDIEGDMDKLVQIFPKLAKKRERLIESIQSKITDPKAIILVKKNIFASDKKKILENGIIGIEFQDNERRIYPQNNIASHVLGFVNHEGVGSGGIEKTFDNYLTNPVNTDPIQLSIDINIQALSRGLLLSAMNKYKAKSATAVIMNIKTGEIISAISLPDFNPNNLQQYNNNNLFNHYSLGVYELGSIFKTFLIALATENHIPWTKIYNTYDPVKIGNFTLHDFRGNKKRKQMNLIDIIKFSSNIGCARIINDLDPSQQEEMLEKLGFFTRQDYELPERGRPILPKKWGLTQAMTTSYGHGIAVTPLHFIAAAGAIVNNGTLINPTFLKVKQLEDVRIIRRNIISRSTSSKVRLLLREVVNSGSGKKAAYEKYDVGGKSGTAIQVDKKANQNVKGISYNSSKVIISFFAAVPMSDPEYAFFITLEEPLVTAENNNSITGGGVIAPLISEIISLSGPMLNIPVKD